MIGSLGIASAENKLSVGYGGEAGHMDPLIERMCARYVNDSLIIPRSAESQALLKKLSIPPNSAPILPGPSSRIPRNGRKVLRKRRVGREDANSRACPILPFVWPVKASLAKYLALATTGAYKDSQYRTVYFINPARLSLRKTRATFPHLPRPREHSFQRHKVSPILVAMERLDARACTEFAAHLGAPCPCSLPRTTIYSSS